MKLYRLILVTPTTNISRGVWAHSMSIGEKYIIFYNDKGEIVAMYPTNITLITNIETKEEYDANKEKSDTYLSSTFEKLYKK